MYETYSIATIYHLLSAFLNDFSHQAGTEHDAAIQIFKQKWIKLSLKKNHLVIAKLLNVPKWNMKPQKETLHDVKH